VGVPPTHPEPGPIVQPCLGRIFGDIAKRAFKLRFTANQVVIILPLPENAVRRENAVSVLGAEGLPGMHHGRKNLAWEESSDDVHMVRHNAPGKEPIAFLVKMTKSTRDFFGDGRLPKMTSASAAIEKPFDDGSRKTLDSPAFVGAEFPVELTGGRDDGLTLGFDAIEDGLGERVGEPEGYEISGAVFFPVGKATAIADGDVAEAGARRPRDSRRDAGATVTRGFGRRVHSESVSSRLLSGTASSVSGSGEEIT